ncbi:transfer protein [Streptomyces xiamenensis]|uniref:transfer protein n=1 Tax=Streptomyces xiamenensis TaxID=408015 RepID=UPI0035DD63F3
MNRSTEVPEFIEIALAVPPGQLVQYNHANLVSALRPYGVTDPACVMVETDGAGGALLTVYRRPPLENLPEVRPADLVMDNDGYITVGRYHDGEPARMRLYVPGSGAQRAAIFGTTGAGKSRVLHLLLAAEKRSGIVSWLADLKQGGQSVPEARGQVDVRVTTPEGAILLLQAGLWDAEDRMRRYAEMGRSAFVINRPDPLLSLRIDEVNRLLGPVCPYRNCGAHYISEIGRAGRSVGEGISISGQAAHVEELGGSDTLRSMLREGDTVLLRWSSGVMASLVSDGLLPGDAHLVPIPRQFGNRQLISRFDRSNARPTGASTGGMAYLLGGPRPNSLMRFSRVGSLGEVDGMDPEILALYGTGEPARLHQHAPELTDWYKLARTEGAIDEIAASLPVLAANLMTEQRGLGKDQALQAAAQHLVRTADSSYTITPAGDEAAEAADTFSPPAAEAMPAPQESVTPPVPPLLEEDPAPQTAAARITTALQGGPLDKQDIITALENDGGRRISVSRVNTVLSELVRANKITSPARGRYQLP